VGRKVVVAGGGGGLKREVPGPSEKKRTVKKQALGKEKEKAGGKKISGKDRNPSKFDLAKGKGPKEVRGFRKKKEGGKTKSWAGIFSKCAKGHFWTVGGGGIFGETGGGEGVTMSTFGG